MIKISSNNDYIINDDSEILFDVDNINVYDFTNDKNIIINVSEKSNVNYFIINSSSSKRTFNVDGNLNVLEISLEETNEELKVILNNDNANLSVKNLAISNGIKQFFIQNAIHNEKQTFSNVENVGIAFDGGNVTFDTTGKIEKGKSKSKCSQLSRGIVMDNKSTITAKPILLIDEYDCFANHGASIGKMSDEDLFYLMSRGLTKDEAFLLILQGMVRPFIDMIPNEKIKEEIENKVNKFILE